MSEVTNEVNEKANAAAQTADAVVQPQGTTVRHVLGLLRQHPLGVVVAIGAAAALVEIELAVGMLAGIGATALLVTKNGPEARQEVVAKGQEVVAKGKAAIERARLALANRAKSPGEAAAPGAATSAPPAEPAAPPAQPQPTT
jgi:hypothetical protein